MEIEFSYFTFIPLNILENGIFIFNIKVVQNGNIIIQMVVILHILYYQVKLYIIPFSGNYLPKGNPVIRICVDEYAPNGSRSTWSEPYQLKGYNQCGLIPAPNFDGFGSSVLELYGTLRPLISGVHSAKIIFAINGIFENSPITKQYKIEWIPGTYYFSTKLGIEPNQNYTLSYTVTYYDYTGKALFPIDKGSYSINVGYSNYSSLKIFD